MATVIFADEIKKGLPGYSPGSVEYFHRESAKLADQMFYEALRTQKDPEVILMNGGTASGKTEFLLTALINRAAIILDTTLSTNEGAKIKIKSILNAKKTPVIYSVIPDKLARAFTAFLHRERKFSDNHFYRTHSNSRRTLMWVVQNYPSWR